MYAVHELVKHPLIRLRSDHGFRIHRIHSGVFLGWLRWVCHPISYNGHSWRKAGIQNSTKTWIPAFAGMTRGESYAERS
ncbi:MAG: hypothetical protein EAZ52_00305 [Alphaproteobacteria bacterium]|nr:MAG: hypothetical protein EAZ52_00305 [Alphaproteobacteria bacterium]